MTLSQGFQTSIRKIKEENNYYLPKKSGFFGFVMINKNNSVECHDSLCEGLLIFFAALRMTTEY